jgi:hypothetical protein
MRRAIEGGLRLFSGVFSIWVGPMLMPLSRTSYAAWCDACLRGSEVVTFPGALVARFVAIEGLRGQGWVHEAEKDLAKAAREEAERSWTGATYCVECATSVRMRAKRSAEATQQRAQRVDVQRA